MEAINEILRVVGQSRPVVIYFLGGNDTGKTSLVTRVAQRLAGSCIAILDADIGQSSILPLTITLLRAEAPFDKLSQLPVVAQQFIPGYDLVRNLERNVTAVGDLTKEATAWADFCLIDTTGFVGGPAIQLKRREIEEAQPELIVGLRRSQELSPILKQIRCPSLLLQVPSWMKKKSEAERRKMRNNRLNSYFASASMREVSAKISGNMPPDYKRRLAGLYGKRFLGLGITEKMLGDKLLIYTPVTENVQSVELTEVKFTPARA